jgi:DNA-binding NtrC family response regulator
LKKRPLSLAPDALDAMLAYTWRGNVRELQNCIERAVILTEGDAIHARHLNLTSMISPEPAGPQQVNPWDGIDLSGTLAEASKRVLAEVERRKLTQALKEASGNAGRAAEILQVSYKMLMQKVRDYGLA